MSDKKAYLMTLPEYLTEVVPVLQEYKKFLKKNKFFISLSYNGIPHISYSELQEAMRKKEDAGRDFDFSKEDHYKRTPQNVLDSSWSYKDSAMEINKSAPAKQILEQKNEYVSALTSFFGKEYFLRSMGEPDNTKSNKRVIKFAIEEDIYKELLDKEQVTIAQLEEYAKSADVKLPKKLYNESTVRRENIYKEIYEKMPPINRQVLIELVDNIDISFKPLADHVYEKETTRYNERIESAISSEIRALKLEDEVPFWPNIFNILKRDERIVFVDDFDRHRNPIKRKETQLWYTELSLKSGWEAVVKKEVLDYISLLKSKFIQSILNSFSKITMPIERFEKNQLHIGPKGFEGWYMFYFKNGSHFLYRTEAISAGGYNIQIFHFRYLTHFDMAKLADGTIIQNPSLGQIIQHFSDAQASEAIFNPYNKVSDATTVEHLSEAIYAYLKTKHEYSNIRKTSSKIDTGVSFKLYPSQQNLKRKFHHGIYFKRDIPFEQNKEKAIVLLEESNAPRPKFSAPKSVVSEPVDEKKEKSISAYMSAHPDVTRDYAISKISERKTLNLPDNF